MATRAGFMGNTDSTSAAASNWQAGWPKKTYTFTYDISLGGTQTSVPLSQLDGQIPINFIIQNVSVHVVTPLGSGGAALAALTTGQSAGDLVAATVVAGVPWSTAGLKVTTVLLGTIATQILTTAARSPALVISGANLNAGRFHIFVEGFVSPA